MFTKIYVYLITHRLSRMAAFTASSASLVVCPGVCVSQGGRGDSNRRWQPRAHGAVQLHRRELQVLRDAERASIILQIDMYLIAYFVGINMHPRRYFFEKADGTKR